MITFIIALFCLIAGYIFYGKFIARYFGVDSNIKTPAKRLMDGVDYQELPVWKSFLIQLLNIAGLGPIFGAILGAMYGHIAYVWIVLGCIFMGGVHDFFSGFASMRNNGMSLPELVGKYMGVKIRRFMVVFSAFLLLIVGVLFTNGPADLIRTLCGKINLISDGSIPFFGSLLTSFEFWIIIIFAYYLLSTILPIGKLIAKIYPFFGIALLFMVFGLGISMLWQSFSGSLVIPEMTLSTLRNFHSNPSQNLIFPMLFVVISCGAISGFHATQSPIMARCLGNEKLARPVFYGAMIVEGIIALIWATAAIAYFHGAEGLNTAGMSPALIVEKVCSDWLGIIGSILAVLGVIVCPITSGDTAFRGMRLILADTLQISQKSLKNRLFVTIPIFIIAIFLSRIDFVVVWKYLGIGNQILATITLWTGATFLASYKKSHWLMSLPACFLTAVCVSYFLLAQNKDGGLAIQNHLLGYIIGVSTAGLLLVLFLRKINRISERE